MIRNLINIQDANTIIRFLPLEFYSHDFINKFRESHRPEYDAIRARYSTDEDRKAHSLIARFLLARAGDGLSIEIIGRGINTNIHGKQTSCALWRKNS